MIHRALLISFAIGRAAGGSIALAACEEDPPGDAGGQSGSAGGGGGACPDGPPPVFTISITAADGSVPPDTSLAVTWSAGSEPLFVLSDSSTWRTLEEGANVVCNVDPKSPPSGPLEALVCRLWTSGPTEIVVAAQSYQSHTETLVPTVSERCDGPLPADVAVTLFHQLDGGPP